MNFFESVRICFSKYFDFTGRARRSEFWWFQLFCTLCLMILGFVDEAIFGAIDFHFDNDFVDPQAIPDKYTLEDVFSILWDKHHLSNIFFYGTLVPSLSVAVRRFHDIGLTGWRLLGLVLMPFIFEFSVTLQSNTTFGIVILSLFILLAIYIYWFAKNSDPFENKYGVSPKSIA